MARAAQQQPPSPDRIAAVRRFNRLYTQRIGVLDDGHLGSPFSLPEARALYELAHREAPAASELARDLGLDRGYLSRLLAGLRRRGLIASVKSADDGRRGNLSLTKAGKAAVAKLDRRSSELIADLLSPLSPEAQARLVAALRTIEELLGPPTGTALSSGAAGRAGATPRSDHDSPEARRGLRAGPASAMVVIRPPRPGELGWVVQKHGALYAEEYGWDDRFEGLVAEIVGAFAKQHDPKSERCWIAERQGDPVGSIFLVRKSATVAQLRLLLVDPSARGLGLGGRLVEECLRFAKAAGYRKVVLWTNSVLHAARRIYERAGFELVKEGAHQSFGAELVGQYWEKSL